MALDLKKYQQMIEQKIRKSEQDNLFVVVVGVIDMVDVVSPFSVRVIEVVEVVDTVVV